MVNCKFIYTYIIVILLIASCTSGKKAFEKGDYDQGMQKAINRLRQSPKNKKAKETLRYGYPVVMNWHKDNIEQLKRGNDIFVYERVYNEYRQMNYINDEIRRCPACLKEIKNMQTFLNQESESALKGAEVRYNFAENLLTTAKLENDKQKAMDAFYSFQKANELVNGYLDSYNMMEEARWVATTKVIVEEVETGSAMLNISADFFHNKIVDYVTHLNSSPFVRFYTPLEAQTLNLEQPDQIIQLQFDHFTVGQIYVKESQFARTKDSVVVATTTDDEGNSKDVYGTAKATITAMYKEVKSNGLLDLKIIEAGTGRVLTQEKLPGEYIWYTEWGNFNGNDKALTAEDWDIIRAKELFPPLPQDLFVAFTTPIFNQVTSKIQHFYSRYN